LLTPAGIKIAWKPSLKKEVELLVVTTFEGNCSVANLPLNSAAARPILPVLGETRVAAGGQVLPFIRIDCNRLVQVLAPALQPLSIPMRNQMFGRALARVMAHEIYHVLAETTDHDRNGIAKPSFTSDDLLASRFEFGAAAMERMQPFTPQGN
jgi:hypothetical protein